MTKFARRQNLRFTGAERALHRRIEKIVREFIMLTVINPSLNRLYNANLPTVESDDAGA
jgi:hypothetical protein